MKIAATAALATCCLVIVPFSSGAAELREWPAASQKGPILIQFKDGSSVEGVGPATGDDRTVRFRLTSGQLVSINLETVQQITTVSRPIVPARPARAREEPSVPTTSEASRAVRYSNEDLPGVFGNTDLPAVEESAADATTPSPEPAAGADTVAGTVSGGGPLDRDGHDEIWWRARVSRLNKELKATRADIERLEKEFRVAKAIVSAPMPSAPSSHGAPRPSTPGPLPLRRNARVSSQDAEKITTFEGLRDELVAAQAREKELQAEIDGLPNEARRAGALPGWIR